MNAPRCYDFIEFTALVVPPPPLSEGGQHISLTFCTYL